MPLPQRVLAIVFSLQRELHICGIDEVYNRVHPPELNSTLDRRKPLSSLVRRVDGRLTIHNQEYPRCRSRCGGAVTYEATGLADSLLTPREKKKQWSIPVRETC